MKREYLSLEDHRKVADELRSIEAAWRRISDLISGKVPCPIIDQTCSFSKFEKVIFRFREDCFVEMLKRHGNVRDCYFGDPE